MKENIYPKYAYMVPFRAGDFPEENPQKPYLRIYKIPVEHIDNFKKRYSLAGWEWRAIYNFLDLSDYQEG